ncbi:MAG: PhnD/SsuA/transferrin family substrate-binding protein [Myxococcales bacterium]|nr:PhnD/SsuA/transferrin family substrate-binding protein [Myxococcales bacterium]MDP3500389.1 PhnD/SsuA/transferrin family substrate-binding protein [Myxococcales bacterium]
MARLLSALVVVSSFVVVAAEPEAPKEPARGALVVGVVASQNPESAKAQAAALSGFVGNAVREAAVSRVFPDQEALALAVAKGDVDYAVMGPLAYLRIDPKANAQLVFRTIRNGKATYRSVLFAAVGKKMTLETIRKASGLKVAWVEPSSASGYLLAKAHLVRAGINPVQVFTTQDFLGSHDAVCKAVAAGTYDLGATFSDPTPNATRVSGCEGTLGKMAAKLTVITATDEVPNDVLVAAPNVKRAKVDLLREAGKAAPGSASGKDSLKAAFLAEAVADVTDADFAPVRAALDAFAR